MELLGVEEGIALLRLQGSCSDCSSSSMTLKLAVEDAIRMFAPELDGIETVNAAQPVGQSGYVPLASLRRNGGGPAGNGAVWQVINDLLPFENGRKRAMDVAGRPVLFLKLENTLHTYRNSCPGCGLALDRGLLVGTGLACPVCGHIYDIRRAGRCLYAPALHLEPVPLLVEAETVKIALPAAVH